ncbi:hypothetical protein CALVIDRAFT_146250 [Calocera viscosa TUFC12733]|uniref:Uncharacterized protein n=1 Tax=Calocera viscosa (strain TUFC12733) TaxID=1330018 RepID=A0A167LTL0_CALVF|nr:hypothetical protein CALVIDRAFT_146250 [Calocera viscosa TUFC12733]
MVGSAATVRHLRTGVSLASHVSPPPSKLPRGLHRRACIVSNATKSRNAHMAPPARSRSTRPRQASTMANVIRRLKSTLHSPTEEISNETLRKAEVASIPSPKDEGGDLEQRLSTELRGYYIPDMDEKFGAWTLPAQDQNRSINDNDQSYDLPEATYQKPIGPPPQWLHYLSENTRGQLRYVNGTSAARLREDYPTETLESDIESMLLQPPRAPGAVTRLRSFWSVIWGSGRIRQHRLAHLFGQLLAKQGFYDDLRTLLHEIQTIDPPLHTFQYEAILEPLAEASAWQPLLQLIELAHSHSPNTSARLLKMKTMALIGLGDFKSLDNILSEYREGGVKADREVYDRLISAWMSLRNMQKVQECISLMRSAGYSITADTWKALISGYKPGNDSTAEERVVAILRGLSVIGGRRLLHKVLSDCLVDRDLSGANFVLNLFEPSPIPERYHAFQAQRTSPSSNDASLEPSAMTFTILLRHLPEISGFGEVPKLWRHMEALGITPAPSTIAALMKAHIQVGNLAMAGRIAYDTCRAHLTSELRRAWQHLFTWSSEPTSLGFRQYGPDIQVYEALLGGLLESTGLRGALLLIPTMQATNVQPTSRTVQLIIEFVRQHMDLNVAGLSRLVTELTAHTNERAPTVRHLNQLLLAAVQANEQQPQNIGWKAFYSRFTYRPGTPDGVLSDASVTTTAGLALSDPIGGGEFDSVVDSLKARGQTPDAFTYNVRLRHEAVTKGDMTAAKQVLTEMLNRGIRPNIHHWLDLMRGCIRNGDMASAERIVSAMRYMKFEVDVRTYTVLMHGYASLKEPQEAMRIFQTMLEQGVQPDWGAIDALTGAYYGARQLETARRILLEYWSYVAPFPLELINAPLSLLIAHFRSAETKVYTPSMFSWDGGPVTEGKLSGRQKHSHSNDISETLIRTWQTVFGHDGNLTVFKHGKNAPLQTVPRSIFFLSRYREEVLRRLAKRIWHGRSHAIRMWEKDTGNYWRMLSAEERRQTNLRATFAVHAAEVRVLNSWEIVRKGQLKIDQLDVVGRPEVSQIVFLAPQARQRTN